MYISLILLFTYHFLSPIIVSHSNLLVNFTRTRPLAYKSQPLSDETRPLMKKTRSLMKKQRLLLLVTRPLVKQNDVVCPSPIHCLSHIRLD